MISNNTIAGTVFALILAATFWAAVLARRGRSDETDALSKQSLNKWLIGLSAGTTANSGFIVTGAVALGYTFGAKWILLPISWLIGDIIFWACFPARINDFGRTANATTLSDLLQYGLLGKFGRAVRILASCVILICLSGYTSAQWLAGQKFLAGAFGLPDIAALGLFAILIISYSSIGGFRGAVYTDALQALVRIVGTLIAIGFAVYLAVDNKKSFVENIHGAGTTFLEFFPGAAFFSTCGFVLGFAAAAIGFGLGQPQIVSRYLAGSSPNETRSAWWIYMGFVQFTWIAMTVFGILLRGIMPNISDPEIGLSLFFQKNIGPIATGVIAADVFATIAATSNGILIAMTQSVEHDLLPQKYKIRLSRFSPLTTALLGLLTLTTSLFLHESIINVALSSVSMMGAGLAGPVMIKIMKWKHSSLSLLIAIVSGSVAAIAWKTLNLSGVVNEAAVGIASGLVANYLVATLQSER